MAWQASLGCLQKGVAPETDTFLFQLTVPALESADPYPLSLRHWLAKLWIP